jgi:hypothetical protein
VGKHAGGKAEGAGRGRTGAPCPLRGADRRAGRFVRGMQVDWSVTLHLFESDGRAAKTLASEHTYPTGSIALLKPLLGTTVRLPALLSILPDTLDPLNPPRV